MSSGADPDNYDEEPEEETGNASGGTASRDERESDALAARLAYECAWRRCDDALRTLRERRTITVAVLSLTLPAAGLVASLSTVGDRMNGASCISAVGWTVLAIAALCALLSAGRVLRPIRTIAAFSAANIVENYIKSSEPGRNPIWVYQHLARDVDSAYEHMDRELAARSFAYRAVLVSVLIAFIGAGIVVLDAAL